MKQIFLLELHTPDRGFSGVFSMYQDSEPRQSVFSRLPKTSQAQGNGIRWRSHGALAEHPKAPYLLGEKETLSMTVSNQGY